MHSGEVDNQWRLGRRPALDGLRGLAVLLVLAAHFDVLGADGAAAGDVGVTVFFTLSGFLITSLLLEETARTGGVARGRFYLRRARRLAPALVACVLLTVVLELATQGRITDGALIVGALTYTSNFLMIASDHLGTPAFLPHTWSLAIEEQFYLLWPLALLALLRLPRRRALRVLAAACLVGVVVRGALVVVGDTSAHRWVGLDARSDALLIGCLLAFWMHGREARPAPAWFAPVGGMALVVLAVLRERDVAVVSVILPLAVAVLSTAVIYGAVTRPPGSVLGSRVMRYVGARSYGLYLYHYPIIVAFLVAAGGLVPVWITLLVAGPATFAVAELSWRFVEQPFLRQRTGQEHQNGEVSTVHALRFRKSAAAPTV